ncbi:EamA family transporter, partial [Staphylococcus aureus]|uniref:EamA family transporter n=1 Tax=Staphylococcus aureus TaxID=1280 RepID=UPI0038B236C8
MAYFIEGKFSLHKYNVKSILYFIIFGTISSALNPIMYLYVIFFTSGTFVSILGQLIPVISSIISIIIQVE